MVPAPGRRRRADDGYAAVDDGQEHRSGPVRCVAEGFAVFDGKEQVTSGTVTIDPATAAQLIAAGAVESQGAAARRPKEKWRGLGRANP